MPATTVSCRLSFSLTVDPTSGQPPFQSRSPLDQQAVKEQLLAPFRTARLAEVQTRWEALTLPLGPNCCDPDLATLRNLVTTALARAPTPQQLQTELGFVPTLAPAAPSTICLVMPDGSHRCTRLFELERGSGGSSWVVEGAGGASGRIALVAEWITPQAPATGGGATPNTVAGG